MSILLPELINWLQSYGYLALWVAICVAAVGVPLPVDLLLLAAGAYSLTGDFNIFVLVLVSVSASVSGDNLGYLIGRWWGTRLLRWLEHPHHLPFISPRVVAQARAYFARRGGWAVFFSRFLLSSIGGEINFLAGANPYSYRRFLLADVVGQSIGTVIPLGLGYLFGASWESMGDLLWTASLFLLAALVVFVLVRQLVSAARHMAHSTSETKERSSPTGGEQSATIPSITSIQSAISTAASAASGQPQPPSFPVVNVEDT